MKKTVLFLLSFILLNVINLKAQECGEGEYIIHIYVLNETKVENIYYEILVASDKLEEDIAKENPPYSSSVPCIYYYKQGLELPMPFIPAYVAETKFEEDKSLAFLRNFDIQIPAAQGKIENGIIKFQTLETYEGKHLLRIYTDEKEVYLYDSLLGGCGMLHKVLWDAHPKIIR